MQAPKPIPTIAQVKDMLQREINSQQTIHALKQQENEDIMRNLERIGVYAEGFRQAVTALLDETGYKVSELLIPANSKGHYQFSITYPGQQFSSLNALIKLASNGMDSIPVYSIPGNHAMCSETYTTDWEAALANLVVFAAEETINYRKRIK